MPTVPVASVKVLDQGRQGRVRERLVHEIHPPAESDRAEPRSEADPQHHVVEKSLPVVVRRRHDGGGGRGRRHRGQQGRQLRLEVDGEASQSGDTIGQEDGEYDGLHALDRQGLAHHGPRRLHQREEGAAWARLEELRPRVVVGEATEVLLHAREVLLLFGGGADAVGGAKQRESAFPATEREGIATYLYN